MLGYASRTSSTLVPNCILSNPVGSGPLKADAQEALSKLIAHAMILVRFIRSAFHVA
jgi:hypothetical protein